MTAALTPAVAVRFWQPAAVPAAEPPPAGAGAELAAPGVAAAGALFRYPALTLGRPARRWSGAA